MGSDMSLSEKNERLSRLIKMREKKANIMLVGSTGSGKSSTINALFSMQVAEVLKFFTFIKFIRKTGQCLSPYPFSI